MDNLYARARQAACVVILDDLGRIAAVDRCPKTGIPDDWNLPGGKVDGGETHAEAAIREAKEELGVDVELVGEVHRRHDGEFFVVVFRARVVGGRLTASSEGPVAWVHPSAMLQPHCAFRDFNVALFQAMGLDYRPQS